MFIEKPVASVWFVSLCKSTLLHDYKSWIWRVLVTCTNWVQVFLFSRLFLIVTEGQMGQIHNSNPVSLHISGRTKEREPKCSQPAESTLLLLQSSSRRNADTAISGTICCCKEYLRYCMPCCFVVLQVSLLFFSPNADLWILVKGTGLSGGQVQISTLVWCVVLHVKTFF